MSLELIHASFKNLIEACTDFETTFENEEYKPMLDVTFGVFQLGTVAIERQSQGKCGTLVYSGEATLTVKVQMKTGAGHAYAIADKVIDYAVKNGLNYGLKFFEPPFVGDSSPEGDWFTLPISLPFTKD